LIRQKGRRKKNVKDEKNKEKRKRQKDRRGGKRKYRRLTDNKKLEREN
jgi:hypothetical protein